MAYNLPDIRTAVASELKDVAGFLTASDINSIVITAIRQTSHDIPYNYPFDINADGSQDYDLSTNFFKGFSLIRTVEYPIAQIPPKYIREDDDWFVYEDPTKTAGHQMRLRFKQIQPSVPNVIRVTIDNPHTVTETTSTLDQNSFLAVQYKTLQLCCAALANFFNQSTAATIQADTVDYTTKSQNYIYLANEWRKKYDYITGVADGIPAGQGTVNLHTTFSHGEDLIWHPRTAR
jgi:hypothetical protein